VSEPYSYCHLSRRNLLEYDTEHEMGLGHLLRKNVPFAPAALSVFTISPLVKVVKLLIRLR
jgi:hypothetical protein